MPVLPVIDQNIDISSEERKHSALLARGVAIVLIVLLAIFFAGTLVNMIVISSQVGVIREGPYRVSIAAGRVETQVMRLRTISQRPIFVRTPEALDNIEQAYEDVDVDLSEKLQVMIDNSTINYEAAKHLMSDYQEVKVIQQDFLDYCSRDDVTDEEIETYYNDNLLHIYDEMLEEDGIILDNVTDRVDESYQEVTGALFWTAIFSVTLMAAVITSLAIYLNLLRTKDERENKLREHLSDALALAQSASAAKSAFLSNVSHDIRTPMNAIIGLTNIAESHIDDKARVKECLARIDTSSKHLLGLINDVLDMNKIESGKLALNEEVFSLPNLVNDFVTIVQPQLKAKHLQFNVFVSNIEQEMLIGDTMRINQVLLNVVGNAIKYTPQGKSVTIHLSEEPSERVGYKNYKMVVTDEGIGIDQEFLKNIFEPFERERNETTNFTEGTGLGLAITKNIVDLMNGTIEVESEVGVGSTFTVVFPLRPSPEGEEDYNIEPLIDMHVLMVDDDENVIENTKLIFKDFKMRGEFALSGFDGLALATAGLHRNDNFQAAIVDWKMPEMDGLETIRRLRAELGDATPILLLTAYDWTEIEDEAKEAGVSTFISKPLFKSRLYHALLEATQSEPTEKPSAPHKAGSKLPIQGRVLLVEDNELNSDIAYELITQLGPEVEIATNGQESVDMVDEHPEGYYDLVFMDWQMPVMDGIQATEAIIEHAERDGRKRPPIVAMTANAFNEHRSVALEAGMDGFMTKPLDIRELNRVLRKYLKTADKSKKNQ